MTAEEFRQRICDAASGDVPSSAELNELILLARLHGGGKLLEDLARCSASRSEQVPLGIYIARAQEVFPVWEDMEKDQIWAQIMAELRILT